MAEETQVAGASAKTRLRRRLRFLRTRARELKMIGKALVSTKHPILVHIIPMRQCNLACTYCNEFDDFSKPVPLEEMRKRLDALADMGTSIITISGGEPLMHPDLDEVIRHMRRRGMIAGLITNGFYLNKERIERLNEAGLEHLQISIDNVAPDEVSKKSLKTLDGRLVMLSQYAVFQVNINSVWREGGNTIGGAVRGRATYTFVRMGWCTGAPSSADIREFRWRSTPRRCGTASTQPKSFVPHGARFPACSRWASWITGVTRRT